jgi:hypothetical protein
VDARIAHHAGDELDATVVAVEPHLAEEHSGAVREIGAAILLLDGRGRFGGGAHGSFLTIPKEQA